MSAPDSLPLADTSDMASLHRVFREALFAAPTLLATVADGDKARADVVGSYYDNVLRLLHGHHAGEDELLTPKLIERRPDQAGLIERIGNQHAGVLGAVATAEGSVAGWRAEPSDANRSAAIAALATLDSVLTPHLDEEELEIVPLAATCINVAEWGQLPEHGLRTFTGDKAWLIMGLVQEQMRPDQIELMQAHLPPPVREFWIGSGQAMCAEYLADLRG